MMTHYERVIDGLGAVIKSARALFARTGTLPTDDEFIAWLKPLRGSDTDFKANGNAIMTGFIHAVIERVFLRAGVLQFNQFMRAMSTCLPGDSSGSFQFLGQMIERFDLLPIHVVNTTLSFQIKASWHILRYETSKKTYQVSDGLAAQLRDTELRGLRTEDIRLPYECLYLEIPTSVGFEIWNTDTGWHPAEGAYIVEDHEEVDDQLVRSWRFMFIGGTKGRSQLNDALVYFTVLLPPGWTLDAVVAAAAKDFTHSIDRSTGLPPPIDVHFGPMLDRWEDLFRWTINAMIYATWPTAEVEHIMLNKEARLLWERMHRAPNGSKKRKDLSKQLGDLDGRRRIRLGSSVIYIDRTRAEAALDSATSSEVSGGRDKTVAVRVQGHWKNQAHGEGRGLRRRIWVQPYWRGLEAVLPLSNAVHKLH
jgi:hypothetical protein